MILIKFATFSAFLLICLFPSILGQYVDMRSVAEGNCPYNGFPVTNINRDWFENTQFRYIIAGSKYHLYRIASDASRSSNSSFVTIREHEFPDTACLETVLDTRSRRGAVYSRGRLVNNYIVSRPDQNEARVIDFTPVPQPPQRYPMDVSRHYIVLTDNQSFVMFANCWTRSYQKSWDVISTQPYLSSRAMDMIEYYIQSLGFNRRLGLFLKFDRCSPNSWN